MARMNLTPASELVDEVWGKVGTPERDEMEAQLKEELNHTLSTKPYRKHAKHRTSLRKNWESA